MKIIVCLFLISLMSCASTHPGHMGVESGPNDYAYFKVSAQVLDYKNDEPFQIVEITLENTGNDWLKFESTEYVIPENELGKTSVVMGKDLKDWAQSYKNKLKQQKTNKELMQLGLLALSTGTMLYGGVSDNNVASTYGLVGLSATTGWILVDAIEDDISESENVEKIPENHIYNGATIPGKSYLRKWIVINKPPGDKISPMSFIWKDVNGKKVKYEFKL